MGRKVTFSNPLVATSCGENSLNCKEMQGLVVKAIQDMKEPKGSSAHSILKYVQNELKGTEVGTDTQKIAEMLRKALDSGIRGVFVYKLKSGKYKLVKMNAGDKGKRPRRCKCCRGASKGRKSGKRKKSKKRRAKPKKRRAKPKKRRAKPKKRRAKPKKRRAKPKRRSKRRCKKPKGCNGPNCR